MSDYYPRIRLERINNAIIEPIPDFDKNKDKRPILGREVFPTLNANIGIFARKFSGKTWDIFNILKRCVGRNTIIIVFANTFYNDKAWINIRKFFEKRGIIIIGRTAIQEKDGTNHVEALVANLQRKAKLKEEEEKQGKPRQQISMDFGPVEKKRKPKRLPYQAPDYILIFDDMSKKLRSDQIDELVKMNRHFAMKTIFSTQYVKDLKPEALQQLDYWLQLVFKGLSTKNLEKIYEDADINIPEPLFNRIYRKATERPFSFLYYDKTTGSFRYKFEKKFFLPNHIE